MVTTWDQNRSSKSEESRRKWPFVFLSVCEMSNADRDGEPVQSTSAYQPDKLRGPLLGTRMILPSIFSLRLRIQPGRRSREELIDSSGGWTD